MRKSQVIGIFVLCIVLTIFISNFVSAASPVDTLTNLWKEILEFIKPIAIAVLGNDISGSFTGDLLFANILFFVIILAICWSVLDRVPFFSQNTWVVTVVSIAVAVLATRSMTAEWINTILLPYSAVGIAITALIPLIIYFYFVEQAVDSSTLRKILWIFAAVIFIGLYFTRLEEIKGLVWVYPVAAGVCIIFLFADKTIQRAWHKAQAEGIQELHEARTRSNLMQQRADLEAQRASTPPTITEADYNRLSAALERQERRYGLPHHRRRP